MKTISCFVLLCVFSIFCCGYGFELLNMERNRHNSILLRNGDRKAFEKTSLFQLKAHATLTDDSSSSLQTPQPITKHVKTANFLGFLMGLGSMAVYTPIIFKLLKTKTASGFAISTWVFNLLGLSCAITYPIKKGFPLSTYTEMINAGIQSLIVLGLVCFYNGRFTEYIAGATLGAIFLGYVLRYSNLSPKVLTSLQITSALISNYANIPQILLTFQTKKSSWSGITASLCLVGCLIRIFTTLKLTKDYVVLGGYLLGLVTNSILLFQLFLYR